MLIFLQDDNVWPDIEKELSMKGVKALTFYDVVLDYILMDAFEDLESPPSSVTAVVQNRWLSNGFKESVMLIIFNSFVVSLKEKISSLPFEVLTLMFSEYEERNGCVYGNLSFQPSEAIPSFIELKLK